MGVDGDHQVPETWTGGKAGRSEEASMVLIANSQEEHVITIDCATCVMRDTAACDDCVVTFLCERDPTDAVVLDLDEMAALRRLADAGLAPRLRHAVR
jgi:hypothetical protein